MKKLFILAITFISILGIVTGCNSNKITDSGKKQVVKLGITGEDHRIWDIVKEKLAKENIDLEIVSFSDYTRPNLALAEKEIDLNAFQHYAFLNKFKADHKLNIVPIGDTVLAPMGIYSKTLKSVNDIKTGGKIAIPNDAVNEGRALNLLQSAGLIKLKEGVESPTPKDIVENPKNLEIVELVATQIPRSLEDVDAAAINSGVAIDAKLSPVEDSIYLENATLETSKPYINLIAAREEDKDNPLYKKVVEAYHSVEVKKAIEDIYKGALIPAF